MSTPRPGTPLPPTASSGSFHGAYDLQEYAALFGEFGVVAHDGSTVLFRSADRTVVSGPGASFGGVLFNPGQVHSPKLKALAETIDGMAGRIRAQCPACANIQIRLAPDIYYPAPFIQTLHAAFAIAGWSNVGEATHVVSRDSFQPRESTLRNARKAERGGCVPCRLDPAPCFDFLSAVKLQKGYRFDYSRPRFLEQVKRFPDSFHCFGVRAATGELLAASFELATPDWALLLNWDQTAEGKSIAATDYLLLARLEELFGTGRRFVDLGTTTEGRKANWGLIRHKENFGGHAVLRNNYLCPSTVRPSDHPAATAAAEEACARFTSGSNPRGDQE